MYDRFNNSFVYVLVTLTLLERWSELKLSFPLVLTKLVSREVKLTTLSNGLTTQVKHRDELYGQRINPIVNKRGQGIILFGDKTGLSYNSAFDRINVRRLFLTVEQTRIGRDAQLFEVNDEITRAELR